MPPQPDQRPNQQPDQQPDQQPVRPRQVQRVAVHAVGTDGSPVSARWLGHGMRPREAAPGGTGAVRGVRSRVVDLEEFGLRVHEIALELDGAGPPHPQAGAVPDLHRTAPPDDIVDHLEPAAAPADPSPPAGDQGAARVQRTGAYALVVDGPNVLLTRLARTAVWTLPGGGVDFGEHPEAAVRREVHEETGLTLTGVRLLDVDSDHWVGHAPYGRLEDFHAVRILYAAGVVPGVEPAVLEVGGSTDAVAWVPVADLGGLELGGTVRMALPHLPGRPPAG